MTDTEINEAIAEVLGYDFDPPEAHLWPSRGNMVKSPKGDILFRTSIPKFCEDLNAMHEVEKAMTLHSQWSDYRRWLANSISSTASHRAESFLRVMGKWRDE